MGCTCILHSSAQATRNVGNKSVKLGRNRPDQSTEHFIHVPCATVVLGRHYTATQIKARRNDN